MNALSIGPLMFAPDRFAAVLAIGIFLAGAELLARNVDARFSGWSWRAGLAFLIGARLGHVLRHLDSFTAEPLRTLAVWQGGFLISVGLVAAVAITLIYLRRQPRLLIWTSVPVAASAFAAMFVVQLTAGVPPTPLPSGTYNALDGSAVAPASLTGKPMVINLWASWCPPCRREMPMVAEVSAANDRVAFLFVNQGEDEAAVKSYLETESLALGTVLLDGLGRFSRHYMTPGLPATLFVGADGRLRSVHMGEISREALLAGIAELQE
ncbi:thiol-disulfide isomerase/thioredoxin [Mesorhizobium soli]|uniref:TlpA disulfide reductase family protein n=1 Tax=Pseudaminobacter soli (ex Li et al. 2025) TaxID=1295366 RepID=UPI002473B67D|nr:TlpA disulfide reductase family protein [Mesorhizobium soli]MDH6233715.1 thiol-disulfide isomerase/thioredoxin [Mesorhizobium soli]